MILVVDILHRKSFPQEADFTKCLHQPAFPQNSCFPANSNHHSGFPMSQLLLRSRIKTALCNKNSVVTDRAVKLAVQAFTLVEMLVVIALMVLLLGLLGPAISSMTQSKGFTAAAYDIGGLFDQARSYAMGSNTYVYVGLLQVAAGSDVANGRDSMGASKTFQEDSKANGALVAAVVASKDGTSGFDYSDITNSGPLGSCLTWTNTYKNGINLVQLGKLRQWENVNLPSVMPPPATSGSSGLTRPTLSYAGNFVGGPNSLSVTPFSLPLGSVLGKGKVNFQRVVMFDPQGVARLVAKGQQEAISNALEVAVRPTHGAASPSPSTITSSNAAFVNSAALQFDCMSGAYKIYRP